MSNHAIVVKGAGDAQITATSIPKLQDDYILVQVHSVAINPTDWKHVYNRPTVGARVGCDYAGTVLEIGSKVTKPFKKGDRVAGMCHGVNQLNVEEGAFQEIAAVKGDVQIVIPENLTFEEAATLGVGITTVGQGLYQSLKLPSPEKPSTEKLPLLIYGGSTATGALAIQYAKLSGCDVVVTCSPRNFDYVKSLGADKAFDYNSPSCAEDIKKYTQGNLKHVFDCIAEGESMKISVGSMSSSGGVYSNLLQVAQDQVSAINPKVKANRTLGYTIFGEPLKFGMVERPAAPEDFEFGKVFWEQARGYLADGKIKVHQPSINEGGKGLEGVIKGLQAMREGKVSGKKLVYSL